MNNGIFLQLVFKGSLDGFIKHKQWSIFIKNNVTSSETKRINFTYQRNNQQEVLNTVLEWINNYIEQEKITISDMEIYPLYLTNNPSKTSLPYFEELKKDFLDVGLKFPEFKRHLVNFNLLFNEKTFEFVLRK